MAKRTTVRDIARAAGVSIATVSRTISQPDTVRPETRKRVLDLVQRMDYRANRMAVDFRRGRTGAIIVLVADIANPFFSEFFKGMEENARKAGYILLIGDTADDEKNEQDYLDMLASGKADGLVLNTATLSETISALEGDTGFSALPLVSCNASLGARIPTVRIDNDHAGRILATHLLELGHRDFAQVSGPRVSDAHSGRFEGFCHALDEAGCTIPADLVIEGNLGIEFGRYAARMLARRSDLPTAVFVHNDETAIGLIHEFGRMDITVPGDVSVVGYDDLQFSAAITPSLTTARLPRRRWGAMACQMMVSIIENRPLDSREILIEPELIVRESSGPPRS
ncbi:LacI family DNA-binding transcriptional regulator [Bauldia sp.]|uniref:LacI family DNA-binding transcriptional regulator n=1 Tax=Bauldia sp. TaxID=2575872 RepID=UPI003BA9670D